MAEPLRYRRSFRRIARWGLFLGLVIGVFLLYRWSDPYRLSGGNLPAAPATTTTATIHMENAPFSAYPNGHKAWSLWAKSVDLEHPPYTPVTSFQSATLTDLRNGVLYASSPRETMLPPTEGSQPPPAPHLSQQKTTGLPAPSNPSLAKQGEDTPTGQGKEPDDSAPLGPPLAYFRAQHGRYLQGQAEPLEADLSLNYTLQWQLKLSGDVDIKTPQGDELHTEALTILELTNLRTHQTEQRLQCDSGATIMRKDVKILANRLRYTLTDHTVELLDGVHGVFKDGAIQAERVFWALQDNVIRAPDTSTGTIQGQNFSAEGLVLDRHRHMDTANRMILYFRSDKEGQLELPSGLR